MTRLEIDLLNEHVLYTLGQVCRSSGADVTFVCELVEEGVIAPRGDRVNEWRFDGFTVVRIHRAYRLHRDLHVNMPGIALALELLDRLDSQSRR